jgi:hypothetical protein
VETLSPSRETTSAQAIAVVGVLFERPRRPAVFACAANLSLAIAIYVVVVSLPPDYDP